MKRGLFISGAMILSGLLLTLSSNQSFAGSPSLLQLECSSAHYRGVFQVDSKNLTLDKATGAWRLHGLGQFILFSKSGRQMLTRQMASRGPESEYFELASDQELKTIELDTNQGLLVMGGEPARLQFFAGSIRVREKASCKGALISDSPLLQVPASE